MEKKIFMIIMGIAIILILSFGLFGIVRNRFKMNDSNTTYDYLIEDNSNKENYEQTWDKVSIKIKENTLTKTGATIVIIDENEELYSFGNGYTLEKNIFGNIWIKLPLKSGYSEEPFYGHGANGITEMKIDWLDRYGELEKGKYRLVKVKDKLYVEFRIDE